MEAIQSERLIQTVKRIYHNNEGYRNIQLQDVLARSEEPEVQFQFVNFSLGDQSRGASSLAKHPGFTST